MDSQQVSSEDLQYVLNHVFLPPKLPQCSEDDTINLADVTLCQLAYKAAREFCNHLSAPQEAQWKTVVRMLKHLCDTTSNFPKEELIGKFLALEEKDVLALHIRAQNAALIVRRTMNHVVFEAFEVSPSPQDVMATEGKLICSYPGPAIEVPLGIAQNHSFVEQLVSFLDHMDVDQLDDALATTTKAGSTVHETRGTTDPKYITELLIAILHGIGKEADVERITKRVADDVCWFNAKNPWRRSPLWLIIRVAVQTTSESREVYKAWVLFFHARLLQMLFEHDFSSDLLHTARVKTSRRAYKLQASAPSSLLEFVEIVVQAVQQKLSGRWSEEQRLQAHSPPFILDRSSFRDHTTLSLNHSREYLAKVLRPDVHSDTPAPFTPSHHPRLRGRDISSIYPNGLTQAIINDPYIALADFERLVQDQLLTWTSGHIHDPTASEILGSCMEQYISATKKLYESSPEDQSLMLLTILDLWVALDTVVCSQIPLLRSYSPEIPASIVEPLLLRSATLLERAARIEQYLSFRHSNADRTATPIFSAQITPSTFSVRYFEQSSSLQAIKSSIEQDASAKRAAKCAELHDLNEEHARLMREYDSRSCEYYTGTTRWGGTYTTHDRYCSRCRFLNQADRMRIDVHEWPLPNGTPDAQATVFELNCPTAFAIWRDRTYQILRDIGMVHVDDRPTKAYTLEEYTELGHWMKNGTLKRIIFASRTKSFRASHYRDDKIPTDNNRICVNNGFNFTLYDKANSEFPHSEFHVDIDSYCTLPLPDGLYQHLKHAVAHTTHTHNSTIVEQANCPKNLSIHEQLAFSNLRCGSQLQWINIVRELRTKILTFSSDEVHTLFTQAAWQIGPLSGDGSIRLWHTELALADFGSVLITEATELLSHVEGNWMEGNTVKTIIYLISRLLASAADSQVHERAYVLLRSARKTTHHWMREILRKLQDVVDDDIARGELQRRACQMAATCRATFDVDVVHLNALLSSSTDVAVLIECAIVIHDNTPPNLGNTFPDFQKLLRRDRRLSHFLESALIEHVNTDRHGMDIALIDSVWPSYRQGDSGWHQLTDPNSRWMMTFTGSQCNQRAQQVHYNTLDGTLLIDGRPLGRLPKEIVGHPTYARIFRQKLFDVIPADMPGMDYATRFLVHGYQLFFAFRDGAPIIRAQIRSGQTIELIPHYIFDEDFPSLFCSEYVHWMAISGDNHGEVEFRPLDDDHIQIWQQSDQNLRLEFSPNGPSHMFHGNGRTQMLVDIRSKSFESIAAQLSPVEYPNFVTLFVNLDCQLISAELPRLRLSFFLNEDDALESNNLQSMVIDNDQCTGTMIGLRSQLVLRNKEPNSASLPRSRMVLIPLGEVHCSLSPSGNHVRIHSNTRSQRQVVWYKYEIDTDLGILVGNVNLTSRLFRIYLHAISSHPLPDPLTHQRGTDLALQELDSAGSFSFQQLTNTDIELLRLIGKISPKREHYPKGLRVMQTTTWSSLLPVLSQHGTFDTAVAKIMQHAASLTIFPELHNKEVPYKRCGDPLLMARAMRRSSIYYELPIELSSDCDKKYYARDCSRNNPGAVEALKTSQLIYAWPVGFTGVPTTSGLLETFKSWGNMTGIQADPNTSLEYSKEWLHLDLPAKWFSLYVLCRQIDQPDSEKFQLLFSFAALAYSNDINLLQQIPVLLAFASINPFLLDAPPQHPSYNLTRGFEPLRAQLFDSIRSKLYSLEESPARQLCRSSGESPSAFKERVYKYYDATSRRKIDNAVDYLMKQWPSCDPRTPFQQSDSVEWFRIRDMDDVSEYFESCFRNSELRTFASKISSILVTHTTPSPLTGQVIPSLQFSPRFDVARTLLNSSPTLRNLLLARSAPGLLHSSDRQFGFKAIYKSCTRDCLVDGLERLIIQFERNHCTTLHKQYCEQLRRSLEELCAQEIPVIPKEFTLPLASCIDYRQICQSRLANIFAALHSALAPFTPAEKVLETAGMWPLCSQRSILQQLASSVSRTYSEEWTESLIGFAEAYIEYQHSQRLVAFSIRADINNFFKEVENASFNNSDAKQNPEWLLIQIQGNFITRPIQSRVAQEMISPSSQRNIVLQLNMGEGKSHVIVPLVAAALADSQKLVRVVVLKPLSRQMFQILVERLSGLANRRIFYLPFSRDVKATPQVIESVKNLFEECVRVGGVLVVQPEHILSFRLMVIDRILSSGGPDLSQAARDLQATQNWLNSISRDILDESDELLHIRYQLIYTMGQQQQVDDGPDRWITTQQIFDLVRQHMKQLQQEFPEDIELVEPHEATSEGQFPHFRLLGSAASQSLVSRIAEDALNGILENLTFVGLGSEPSLRTSVLHFITVKDISPEIYRSVAEIYATTGLWKGLLLLRGLLAHGILVYVLSRRRYRVDYGLDPKRSLLAVPYRAKDVPSLRSEFGHPDVVVCLTCLSYYYEGLTPAQVRESFEILSKLDNPSLEYQNWVRRGGGGIPDVISELIGVNMKDIDAFTRNVIPSFRHNKGTIDFYLSHVVFPKEAKEFPNKLGTSGWDLAESKVNFTTGFSGTNDNSSLLPTSITQTDPVKQLRTNAQVLEYLLRPENKRYVCWQRKNGGPCSAAELLEALVHEPEDIRVLLDVGAQMLEMTNQQLVEYWLSLRVSSQDIKAGVFFDHLDTLSVVTRDGSVELLHSSPFFQRLDQCIVYLDDAHTRGTDLKLPRDFRALVTLGPKVTKDKLVQGCMRMRSLGHGQSVVFCAPPEVDRHIRKLEGVEPSASIQVADVLSWAMANTCTDIEDHISHWVQQGVYYHKRRDGNLAFTASQETEIGLLKTSWLEPAAQTLDEMYGITTARSSMIDMVEGIPAMQDRLKQLGLMEASGEAIAEEQEREVSHELEEEAQLERPPAIPAAKHRLDEEVRMFVRYGTIQPESRIFVPLLTPLRSASETLTPPNPWTKQLLCTRDFMMTTTSGNERTVLTEYLRPVNWIVSHIRRDGDLLLVVMSPYEVNTLLEDIRRSQNVRLHVYAPRTSESMKPFDLSFYCIPPLDHRSSGRTSLTNDIGYQLNIWAGQLYLDSYESYLRLCLLLGLSSSESDADHFVESDRFVPPHGRSEKMSAACLFDKSPIPLLKVLLGLRRKGMGFQSTHMGKIVQARLLHPKDFEE